MEKIIKFLESFLKRSSKFGNVNDEILYKGTLLKYRKGPSGFFYEFPVYGIFKSPILPDLHISIFDNTGFAKPHVTFKPDKYGPIAFHYGFKKPESNILESWITNDDGDYLKDYVTKVFYELINFFHNKIPKLQVHRRDDDGNLIKEPYPFNIAGTAARIIPEHQQNFVWKLYRNRENFITPDSNSVVEQTIKKRKRKLDYPDLPLRDLTKRFNELL